MKKRSVNPCSLLPTVRKTIKDILSVKFSLLEVVFNDGATISMNSRYQSFLAQDISKAF